MSWWCAGAIGAARKKLEKDDAQPKYQSVALIIGVTGIVSNSLDEILPLSEMSLMMCWLIALICNMFVYKLAATLVNLNFLVRLA
ncbi:hypothetical protein LguiA_006944 [Lonicera macranthoides]